MDLGCMFKDVLGLCVQVLLDTAHATCLTHCWAATNKTNKGLEVYVASLVLAILIVLWKRLPVGKQSPLFW